jgi:hypothetical protein
MISVNVVINDGTDDVISMSFSKRHYSGDPIADIKKVFEDKIKKSWDEYKAEKYVLGQDEFTDICSDLTDSITSYTNI